MHLQAHIQFHLQYEIYERLSIQYSALSIEPLAWSYGFRLILSISYFTQPSNNNNNNGRKKNILFSLEFQSNVFRIEV